MALDVLIRKLQMVFGGTGKKKVRQVALTEILHVSKEGKISLLLTKCVCLPTKIRATEKVLSLVSTCNSVCVLQGAYYCLFIIK